MSIVFIVSIATERPMTIDCLKNDKGLVIARMQAVSLSAKVGDHSVLLNL